jgi:hypothetical protein
MPCVLGLLAYSYINNDNGLENIPGFYHLTVGQYTGSLQTTFQNLVDNGMIGTVADVDFSQVY